MKRNEHYQQSVGRMVLYIFYFYLALMKLSQVGINSLIFNEQRRIKEAKLPKVTLLVSGGGQGLASKSTSI